MEQSPKERGETWWLWEKHITQWLPPSWILWLHPKLKGASQNQTQMEKIKHCPLPVKKKSFLGSQQTILAKILLFLPAALWAPRWIQGDTAKDIGSGRDETDLPTGGDNSSLLELWQFLLVLNSQELLEVITSHSHSIYSCCLSLFILHLQHTAALGKCNFQNLYRCDLRRPTSKTSG